eukprot:3153216-Pyramimonas_sp.AAC.2
MARKFGLKRLLNAHCSLLTDNTLQKSLTCPFVSRHPIPARSEHGCSTSLSAHRRVLNIRAP